MDKQTKIKLEKDDSGLLTYEYIANHIDDASCPLDFLVENIIRVDKSGQFAVSTARYLNALDSEKYHDQIDALVKAAITKDRERAYLPMLAAALWGNDYADHAAELCASDDNFRRIYKRLYPVGI